MNTLRTAAFAAIVTLWSLVLLVRGFSQSAADPSPPGQIFVVCTGDQLFVSTARTVALAAFTDPKDAGTLSYSWVSSGGVIEGAGFSVVWHLDGVLPGIYRATVAVSDQQNQAGSAWFDVTVMKPSQNMGLGLQTGRSFLVQGKQEERGFGLYSYFLFGSRLGSEKAAQCKAALMEFLKFDQVMDLQEVQKDRSQLNVSYLLLRGTMPRASRDALDSGTKEGISTAADWLLANYDYVRSQSLLSQLKLDPQAGPYIVSLREPLSPGVPTGSPCVLQDLSLVPSSIISLWVDQFVIQAAQEESWGKGSMNLVVLKMRTYLQIVGEALPPLLSSLSTVVQFKDKL